MENWDQENYKQWEAAERAWDTAPGTALCRQWLVSDLATSACSCSHSCRTGAGGDTIVGKG